MKAPTENTISSPCVSICALNEEDICTGCYRSADEIRNWVALSNQQKRGVLAKALDREKQINPFL